MILCWTGNFYVILNKTYILKFFKISFYNVYIDSIPFLGLLVELIISVPVFQLPWSTIFFDFPFLRENLFRVCMGGYMEIKVLKIVLYWFGEKNVIYGINIALYTLVWYNMALGLRCYFLNVLTSMSWLNSLLTNYIPPNLNV